MSERLVQLERSDAERKTIERIATMLENYSTNELYHKALLMAANLVRAMKHEEAAN